MNENFLQAVERFRQQMTPADYPEGEDIFADVRDRSPSREVALYDDFAGFSGLQIENWFK